MRLERRHRRMPEGAAVPVGDLRVADVLMAGAKLARRALQEDAGNAAGRRLDDLARRADEVGRDEPVLPRQRRRVAGVVDEHRRARPRPVARCGRRRPCRPASRGVEADHIAITVREVAVRGEPAASPSVRQRRRNRRRDRLAGGFGGRAREGVEVARCSRSSPSPSEPRRAGVRVAEVDEDPRARPPPTASRTPSRTCASSSGLLNQPRSAARRTSGSSSSRRTRPPSASGAGGPPSRSRRSPGPQERTGTLERWCDLTAGDADASRRSPAPVRRAGHRELSCSAAARRAAAPELGPAAPATPAARFARSPPYVTTRCRPSAGRC